MSRWRQALIALVDRGSFVPILALLSVAVIPAGQAFTCTPTRVWDGDGPIWCAEGPRVRVSGVAAREVDGSCRKGHPCPDASAEQAKNTLVHLVGKPVGTSREGHTLVVGPAMTCQSTGSAGGNRTGAFCNSPMSGDLSCGLVAAGVAARWDRYWGHHKCD